MSIAMKSLVEVMAQYNYRKAYTSETGVRISKFILRPASVAEEWGYGVLYNLSTR